MRSRVIFPAMLVMVSLVASMLLVTRELRAQGGTSAGSIRGAVTDSAGGTVPDAVVTVTNGTNGFTLKAKTATDGIYEAPNIVVGTYTVTAEKEGFKLAVMTNVVVHVDQPTTVDFQLTVGAVAQTVTVTSQAAPINTESADLSTSVSEQTALDLPLQVNGGFRNFENFLFVSPGVSGNGFETKLNGAPGLTFETYLDGMPILGPDHPGTEEGDQPPYEAIDQFTVITQPYDAEHGIGLGQMNLHFRSGTNQIHGSVYEYLRNNILDSRGHFAKSVGVEKQDEYGFNVGGPLYIPKLLDRRNKTFWDFTYSRYWSYGAPATSLITLPTQEMLQGNFTHYTDSNGNLIPIYDPTTTGPDGLGGFTRAQFNGCNNSGPLNTICPAAISPISQALEAAMPVADLPGAFNNHITRVVGRPAHWPHVFGKIDENIGSKWQLHGSIYGIFYAYEQQPAGVPEPMGVSRDTTATNLQPRFAVDTNLRPNLQNMFGIMYKYGLTHWTPLPVNTFVNTKISPFGPGYVFPSMSIDGLSCCFGSSPAQPYKTGSYPDWAIVDRLVWLKGKHQLKFGMEYKQLTEDYTAGNNLLGSYAFSHSNTSLPDSSNFGAYGSGFATWLLGDVTSYSATSTPLWSQFKTRQHFWYIQDDYRATSHLTVNLGLRWGWFAPIAERWGRMSTFDPAVPNPGADGRLGSLLFTGQEGGTCFQAGGASLCRHRIEKTDFNDFEPRLGFAYRLGDKTVLRGGYGVEAYPPPGTFAGPIVGQDYSAQFTGNEDRESPDGGITSVFGWDSAGTPPPVPAPERSLDALNGQGINFMGNTNANRAYMQSWSGTFERALPGRLGWQLSYVGSKGTRTPASMENLNQVNPGWLSLGSELGDPVTCLAAGTCPKSIAAGVSIPFSNFSTLYPSGTISQALRPFPQYYSIYSGVQENGNSTYHSLQTRLQKEFASGLSYIFSYTLSKNISNGDLWFSGWNPGPLDTYHRGLEKALDSLDQTHVLAISGMYQLPVGPTKRFLSQGGPVGKFLGGWEVAWFLSYASGTPIGIGGGFPNSNYLYSSRNAPNVVPGVPMKAAWTGKFDPATDRYLNPAAFTTAGPYTLGNAPPVEPNLRTFWNKNENFSLIKRTTIWETVNLEFRAEAFNLFNRTIYGGPDSNTSDAAFGTIGSQANAPRQVQMDVKLNF